MRHLYLIPILLTLNCGAPVNDLVLDADIGYPDAVFGGGEASDAGEYLVDAGALGPATRIYIENGSHEPLLGDQDPATPRMTVHSVGSGGIDIFDWNFINSRYPCASTSPCVETIRYPAPIVAGCSVSGAASEVRASNTTITRRLLHGDRAVAEQTAAGSLAFPPFLAVEPVTFEYEPTTCTDRASDCSMTVYSQYLAVTCP